MLLSFKFIKQKAQEFLLSILSVFIVVKKRPFLLAASLLLLAIFLLAEAKGMGRLPYQSTLAYAFLVAAVHFTFILIYQSFQSFKKYKIAFLISFTFSLAISLIHLSILIYTTARGTTFGTLTWFAVFQTHSQEAYEYITYFVGYYWIGAFFMVIAILGTLLFLQENRTANRVSPSSLLLLIISFSLISYFHVSEFSIPRNAAKSLHSFFTLNSITEYQAKKEWRDEANFYASKKTQGETYIIVIGESLNKRHMGIYGYFRKTTPNLAQMKDIILFRNAYSHHVQTLPSILYALSYINQYNADKYRAYSPSIVNMLNEAGVESYWVTNQCLFNFNGILLSPMAYQAKEVISLRAKKTCRIKKGKTGYDGETIGIVEKILSEKTNKNRVIFVHLQGSHFKYNKKYPRDSGYNKFSRLTPEAHVGDFGRNNTSPNINFYDDSVLYNDYVVSSLLKTLQKHKSDKAKGFVYFSDHGEDAIAGKGHSPSRRLFTFEMVNTPMIAWFNDKYKKIHSNQYKTLANHSNRLFSLDLLYDTLLGLMDVKTNKYNAEYDLSSQSFNLSPEKALISFHAWKYSIYKAKRLQYLYLYLDEKNYIWWLKQNSKYLKQIKQEHRVFPHRVNSIGKLHDIWNHGFRSFEVDVFFGYKHPNKFQVMHDPGAVGHDFETFITSVDHKKIKRIWLDFKRLKKNNYAPALARLNALDKKYNLKDKIILESSTKGGFFRKFSEAGWHISYWLPLWKTKKAMQEKDETTLKALAKEMSERVKNHKASAVSFEQRHAAFVEKYLDKELPKNVVYHTWGLPPIDKKEFIEKISNHRLFLNKRVATLIAPFKSPFHGDK